MLESVDSAVSNTAVRKDVWVRLPPAAPDTREAWPRCRATPPYPLECVDEIGLGASYVYLLGLYLGDGMLSMQRNGVWRLRIFQDARYEALVSECGRAMRAVVANGVTHTRRAGCLELVSYWKHWVCVFPQHGSGVKHQRSIVLRDWRRELVERFPRDLVRGLIHSDGCRVTNFTVSSAGKRYEYPRYHFSNRSDDIRELFVSTCHLIGVDCRPNNRWNISVARRASVAILDEFIGPKR